MILYWLTISCQSIFVSCKYIVTIFIYGLNMIKKDNLKEIKMWYKDSYHLYMEIDKLTNQGLKKLTEEDLATYLCFFMDVKASFYSMCQRDVDALNTLWEMIEKDIHVLLG